MSHIEINSNDLTLLANDIDEISGKISSLKDSLNSKFESVKEESIYDRGFTSMNKYLDRELDTLVDVKTKIKKYQSDVKGLEDAFGKKFDNIVVPNISSSSTTLFVASPATFANPVSTNGSPSIVNYESVENDKSGPNIMGALAGAAGIIGAGGLAGATYMKSKEEKEEEDKEKEEKIFIEEKPSTETLINNIVKEYY